MPLEAENAVLEPFSGLRRETRELARLAKGIIQEVQPPVTVRQLFYALIGRGYIPNTKEAYRQIVRLMTRLRYRGEIPYEWIVDRSRHPIEDSTWSDPADFLNTVRSAYRKGLWQTQPHYVEIWLEKDALSGVFSAITREYQVRLMVGRGFSSISFLYEASMDLADIEKPIYIYFFGDHDPSGIVIESNIAESLRRNGVRVAKFKRIAILPKDIDRYHLPPATAKSADPRYRSFVEKYGTNAVELDALPPKVLRKRIVNCITEHLNLAEWQRLKVIEEHEQQSLAKIIGNFPKYH